jgi:hypothetical protein
MVFSPSLRAPNERNEAQLSKKKVGSAESQLLLPVLPDLLRHFHMPVRNMLRGGSVGTGSSGPGARYNGIKSCHRPSDGETEPQGSGWGSCDPVALKICHTVLGF